MAIPKPSPGALLFSLRLGLFCLNKGASQCRLVALSGSMPPVSVSAFGGKADMDQPLLTNLDL